MERILARFIIVISTFLAISLSQEILDIQSGNNTSNHRRHLATDLKKEIIQVLIFDRVKGYLNWVQDWFIQAAIRKCSTRCILTDDKSELPNSDVVIFHAPTHEKLPKRYSSNAIFALLSMEQPKYARVLNNIDYVENNFDLLATYSMEPIYPGTNIPNMPITYFPLNLMSINSVLQPARPFESKNAYGTNVNVAVFASNCKNAGAIQRLKYLEELMKFVTVHSYGKCLNNRQEPDMPADPRWPAPAQRRLRKIKVLSQYKFYLAFENLAVEDYVSEKIFEGVFAGAVPIYRGSSTIDAFMPSNDSYINANALEPQKLAELIKSLSKDKDAYAKFFAFKSRPIAPSFADVALKSYIHPNVLCRFCSYGQIAKKLIHENQTTHYKRKRSKLT